MNLREATPGDAPAIAALYAHHVLTSTATFEEEPPDAREIASRMHTVQQSGMPWLVAVEPGGTVLGYAYAGTYRPRSAFRYTVENSVYNAPEHMRRGIGLRLMADVIASCRRSDRRQMVAVIGDSANAASIRFHARLGFATIGTHPAVGFKFGRWIDVVHMQLALT